MKKLLITALAVMATMSIYAQGSISFQNSSSTKVKTLADGAAAPVDAAANLYAVGIWWAPAGSTDASTFSYLAGSETKISPAGVVLGGAKTITGIAPGAVVAVQIRGYQFGSDYATCSSTVGMYSGATSILTVDTGDPTTVPPGSAASIITSGFTGLILTQTQVPEPSTIALGMLGLAGLFLLRRRS
jgi:hypothetical protein